MAKKHLGYQPQDSTTEYAKYYDETIQPVPDYVQSALESQSKLIDRWFLSKCKYN